MPTTATEDEKDQAVKFDSVFAHRLPTGAWAVGVSAQGGGTAISRGAPGESFDVVLDAAVIDLRRRTNSYPTR